VPRALRRLEDERDGILCRLEIGCEAALVADARREPALVQHGPQVVEDLGSDAEGVGEAFGAGRYDHEFLQVESILRMGAPVEDVHERHRQDARVGAAEPAEQGLTGLRGCRLRRGQGAAENCIGAEPALRRRAVELDEDPVDLALIGRVDPGERLRDLTVDVGDRLQHSPAEVELGISVPELHRLVLARGRSGGDGGASERVGGQSDVDLERRIPARVQDLAGVDVRDPAHTSDSFARS
jgi:hypothetical protein